MCLVLTLLLGQRVRAERSFVVDVWGIADRLPQSSIISMVQTRDGYLWLGTLHGLVRFDGNAFTRFNVNNTPGLPSNRIIFLFEDSRGVLWISTQEGGFCAVRDGMIQNFDTGGPAGKVTYAEEDEQGLVWFKSEDNRIFCWKHDHLDLQPAVFPVSLFLRAFHLVVPGKNGVIWQLQNGHVQQWRGGRLARDYGMAPWQFSTAPATFKAVDGSSITLLYDANLKTAVVNDDGNLVVGTADAGVFCFDAVGGHQQVAKAEGLSENTVLSLSADHAGNLWVGTDGGGLDRLRRNFFATAPQFHIQTVQSIAEDLHGGVWAAFNGGGLSYWLTNNALDIRIGNKNNAWCVLVDRRQQVWAGTRDEGLFQYDYRTYSFLSVPAADQIGPQINALFQSRDGTLWVGGQNGLGAYDGQHWKFYAAADGLPAGGIGALAEAADGRIWLGASGGGLFVLRAGKIDPVAAPLNDLACLFVDGDDTLWLGTSGHGLARLDTNGWTLYSTTNGLATDNIGYLIGDDLGSLWLGSYEGLMRLTFARGTNGPVRIISSRTLLAQECSAGAQPAALRAQDGRVWFPTIAGPISVRPSELRSDTNLPPVVIESVQVDGVEQKTNRLQSGWAGAVVVSPAQEQLDIHFTSLDFSAPRSAQSGARFRYRLEGYDHAWTEAGGVRLAHYSKLPPGDFHFHVIACNEDGRWNETGATLVISVQPPFWRRPGFILTGVLAVLGILAGTIYLISTARLRRQVRALQQLELIERERARIARDLHDQLGANLTQVTLLGEMAEADKDLPGEVEQYAQQICVTARETTRSLDEIVWAVNPSNDTLEGLANYACKYAQDYFALAGIRFRAEIPSQIPPTPILPEVRHNVFLAFKEAVHNVVKHAQATEARVRLQLEPGRYILCVEDNGRGPGDLAGKTLRNGLKNMSKRLAEVRGEFEIAAGAGGGTIVQLKVPITKL